MRNVVIRRSWKNGKEKYLTLNKLKHDYIEDDLKCVARALLPEVSEGSKLRYEMMSYEVMD